MRLPWGRDAVLLNETKSTAKPEYAKDFVEFLRSGEFALYFPGYANRPVVPVFSSLYVPDDVVAYLTGHGVYVVGGDGNAESCGGAGGATTERVMESHERFLAGPQSRGQCRGQLPSRNEMVKSFVRPGKLGIYLAHHCEAQSTKGRYDAAAVERCLRKDSIE